MASPRQLAGRLRNRLPDEGSFHSPLHAERPAAYLGLALGVSFSICFLTGLLSHAHQHPPSWFDLPARPAGLYRVTQGLHVTTGIASVPLLLAKLWTVYPQFWARPAVRGLASAVERLSLVPLVAGAVFLLYTGVINIAYWYDPLDFFFPAGHFWAAWTTMGALVVHVAAKLPLTGEVLRRRRGGGPPDEPEPASSGLRRRGFLLSVGAASATLVLATVGQSVGPLRRLALLSPRRPDIGPQGYPVNKAASQAGLEEATLRDPSYRVSIEGEVERPLALGLEDLRALPQHEAVLPIACVEGWSFDARWRGVRVRDLVALAGGRPGAGATVESAQPVGRYRTSPLNPGQLDDPDTLLAMELDGEELAVDHGYPVRLISPNRPGVQQTKWVDRVVVG